MEGAPAKPKDPFELVGTTLEGQYRVEQVVGEGGFGVVYRAWHLSLEQPIAVKALKVLADDRAVQDALFAKFKDEAKLLYTLSQASLNIVRAIDFGATTAPNGLWAPYMVLEWLAGRSLADDLAERRRRGLRGRTIDEAMTILETAAEGLAIAHQRRVAHRDIKPANFFVLDGVGTPRVKVLDFGIAKVVRDNELPGTRSPFSSFTWLYAAPEQLDSRLGATGLATDVYAFALLLTELLTDRVPVEGRDVVALMKASSDPTVRPTPKQRGAVVPDGIEVVCRRALAVDPRQRYGTIGELWEALVAARRGSSVPAAVGTPASGVLSAASPSQPVGQPSKGVFIPSGAVLGGAATHGAPPPSPPAPMSPQGRAPSHSPPAVPPTYPSPHGPPAPPPGYAPHPGAGPMLHPSQLSPPPMGPPPTYFVPRRPVPQGSQWPLALAIIGIVLGLMFVVTCSAIHAACN